MERALRGHEPPVGTLKKVQSIKRACSEFVGLPSPEKVMAEQLHRMGELRQLPREFTHEVAP
jgi:hypothetical protein